MNLNKVYKINLVLFVALILGVLAIVLIPSKAYAACEPNYGGGETCVYNKTFEVEKKVRIEGDNSWKDKVIDVKEGEVIQFRVTIENIGEVAVDDMKMEDFLPDELERIGGSGLTEYWDDFKVDEKKKFVIEARIISSEFDRDGDFEKCVVNKAEATYDGTLEGSDTATVCYGDSDVKELPETGATSTIAMTVAGLVSTVSGLVLRKKK